MQVIFDAATKVTTLIGLVAFVVACILVAYLRKLHLDERLARDGNIENLSYLKAYVPVDSRNLQKEDQLALALSEISIKDRNYRRLFFLALVGSILFFGYSYFVAFLAHQKLSANPPLPPPATNSSTEALKQPSKPSNEKLNESIPDNMFLLEQGNILAQGPKEHCNANAQKVSYQEVSSFVSSENGVTCTYYVKASYNPFDKSKQMGDPLEYKLIFTKSGTTTTDGSVSVYEIYPNNRSMLFSDLEIGERIITLKNNHVYVFEMNSQVNKLRSPGTNKLAVRLQKGQ